MKIRLVVYCLVLAPCAFGQNVWEKRLAPGLLYRQEIRTGVPQVINAICFAPGSPAVKLVCCKSTDHVFDSTPNKGRETVTSMIRRKNAIAGMNGDFFQSTYTGDPIGVLVRAGELISTPIAPRAAFGWGGGAFQIAVPQWKGTVTISPSPSPSTDAASTPSPTPAQAAQPLPLDGINQTVDKDRIDIEAPVCGIYTAATPNKTVFAKVADGSFAPNGALTLTVTTTEDDVTGGPIPNDAVVLVATGAKASALSGVKTGDRITVNLTLDGFDWSKINDAIGGGPELVSDGKVTVDWQAERFQDSFANKRYPRSAVGVTAAGDLWFVTVDGRQPHTAGATLTEMAEIMRGFGCVQAMNLDGGGSAELAIAAGPLNRPSDGRERPVADAFLFQETPGGESEAKFSHTLSMRFPGRLDVGGSFNLSLVEGGRKVPNREVIWMSWGSGWVDQGGTLHGSEAGSVQIIAFARGTRIIAQVPVGTGGAATDNETSPPPPDN
jgi:hypothetical protein